MYKEYWDLTTKPFHNTPDPRFFYHSAQHSEALMRMKYAVTENMGSVMLTGVYGCGKTLLAQVLMKQMEKANVFKYCVAHPSMRSQDVLRIVQMALSEGCAQPARVDGGIDCMVNEIKRVVQENKKDGKHTVLVMDEVHLLENLEALETVRLLLNLQSHDEFLLTLMLLGHLELAERVAGLKQLAQRVPITATLTHFDAASTAQYINSRLAVAGRDKPAFEPEALSFIHRNSGGIPRRINTLCDVSLALGFAQKVQLVDTRLVVEALEKFGVA